MTREEREDAINCFKNKIENEVYGSKYNKLALEALEQESCDDCISRQSVLDKIQRLINAEQNNIDENGDYMNYARERVNAYEAIQFFVENDCLCPSVTPQFSSGLDKELEKDFGESDCISRDSAIKALDYDIKCFEFKPGVSKHMDDIAKLLNTIYETQVNNIKTLPSVPQEPILEKIRAEMFEEMLSHSGTGEEVIQAYADGLKKGLDILDKYKAEFEAKKQG